VKEIDLVVFGGQVPPDRKAELGEEFGAINPGVIFVQGLAGIPGLIINQVRGAFGPATKTTTRAPTYTPDDRSIRLTLSGPADVKVTVWWQELTADGCSQPSEPDRQTGRIGSSCPNAGARESATARHGRQRGGDGTSD
jgi:hypothetical protein